MPQIPAFSRTKIARFGKERQRERETPRATRAERGYNAEWTDIRDQKAAECKGLCQECLRRGYINHLDVIDHVMPLVDAPERRLDPENLQGLCAFHHNVWKRSLEAYARKTNALQMLHQWCFHPETRPLHFQIMKFGPLGAPKDVENH